jgi:hypothetical protein
MNRQENESHAEIVTSFTDYHRTQDYTAEMDALLSQQETSIDFTKMMHRIVTIIQK